MKKLKYLKFIDNEISSLDNKTIVVTGANSGIGFCATTYLCYKNAKVIMACRNEEKAKQAMNEIKEYVPSAQLDFISYDQADFNSISSFSKLLKEKYHKIDAIIFNAGIFKPSDNSITIDGFQKTIGTNFIGAFQLLRELEDYLLFNHSKCIFVGSIANKRIKKEKAFDTIINDRSNLFSQYNHSKFLIMSSAYALSQNSDLDINIFHPGVCSTNIVSGYKHWFSNLAKFVLKLFTHSSWKASLGLLKLISLDSKSCCLFCGPRGLFHVDGYPKIYPLPKKNKVDQKLYYKIYREDLIKEYKYASSK
jgi:NAD(P)-dependent dehydrogenase (short-subunit alcohol dehydrogenase family)